MNKAMSKYLSALTMETKEARKAFARGRYNEAWKMYFHRITAIQDVMLGDDAITLNEFSEFVKLCSKKLKEFDKYYL